MFTTSQKLNNLAHTYKFYSFLKECPAEYLIPGLIYKTKQYYSKTGTGILTTNLRN